MSESVTRTCDCGCGKSVTNPHQCGWFVLSQLEPNHNTRDPKLERPLHFSTLHCLLYWVNKVAPYAAEMQKSLRYDDDFGTIISDAAPGLYF